LLKQEAILTRPTKFSLATLDGRERKALPFIFVELNTTTMNMAPELKQNPPPFKQSMGRYEALLKSIRLRPTTPPMPDMVDKVGK
jgi:hypothetical protein